MKNWLIGKDPDVEKDRGQEKGATKDEVFGWHHLISGHECEQTPDNTEGQKSVACCSSWGHRVGHYWASEQQQIQCNFYQNTNEIFPQK